MSDERVKEYIVQKERYTSGIFHGGKGSEGEEGGEETW